MEIQIDEYLVEALMSELRGIDNTCSAIDRYVFNVGTYPSCCNDSIMILYDNLINQIVRKSKLLKFKDVFLRCVNNLNFKDRQLYEALTTLKNTKKKDLCFLLNIKIRTFYRRIEILYRNLAEIMQKSKESQFILDVCREENFIKSKYRQTKMHRQSYIRDKSELVGGVL